MPHLSSDSRLMYAMDWVFFSALMKTLIIEKKIYSFATIVPQRVTFGLYSVKMFEF